MNQNQLCIVIDAGHGGSDPGKIGCDGVLEKDINLSIALLLKEALEKGYMPTLKKWIESGEYNITGWETDYSSQTGASQAGILHGNNENIPAFRWVEKDKDNKIMVSVRDAAIIEGRISNGKGLLHINGASRTNLFSGDTENVLLTYSKVNEISEFYTKHWYYIFSNSTNFIMAASR